MMAQSVVETCEICNQALGIDFCEECEQTFCNHCKLMHLRMKISRNHTFKNVDHEEVKLNLCDQHNLGYILYCEKCNSLACKTCIIENHKGHELEDINIAKISELQVEVSEKLESYSKEIHEGSRNSLLLMKDQMKNHEKACKKAIEEINCRSNAIKSCVDKIENLDENLNKIEREYWTILDKRNGVALLKSLQKFQKDNNNLDLEIPVVPSLGQTLAAQNRCKYSVFDMTVGLFDGYNFD
ncbi:unnamed protein product [Mytilus edulis]|uniref:B box-type domain-containing protein n=1 Tax=Mytilus edulis TaxID=6550 RepID=A0A8S3QPG0_MYTED|nr:unnamed protein product [Mytilus edulis]